MDSAAKTNNTAINGTDINSTVINSAKAVMPNEEVNDHVEQSDVKGDGVELSKNTSNSQDTKQWQRLSPIAILYFTVKVFSQLFSNIIYLTPIIILSYEKVLANPQLWLPVILLSIALIVALTTLKFYFFQYRLTNGHIEIRSGIFSKKHINLPFDRIQNVKLEQPLYYRPFSYTCLQLDTAGSSKQEAKIVALKVDFAEQLKTEILASHKNSDAIDEHQSIEKDIENNIHSQSITDEKGILLNQRSLSDLIIHGISSNRVWLFVGLLAPFLDEIAEYGMNTLLYLGIDAEALFSIVDKSWWQIGVVAGSLTFLVLFVVTLFSIAGAIISFYNFTLHKIDDRYIRRSGLFTKHEVTMRLSRLQMVVKQQDWLDVLLKRINLKFEQSNANLQNIQAGANNNKIIVPSVKVDECAALIDDVYPNNQLMNIDYQPIHKHYLLRYIGYTFLPITVALSFWAYVIDKPLFISLYACLFLLLSTLTYCRWLRWGFAQDDNYIYIRKGMLGVNFYCFPLHKVQQVRIKQSYFLKRKGLANINLITASGAQKIPFVHEHRAIKIADEVLFEVESSGKSWM
jgi:putative membrane protein